MRLFRCLELRAFSCNPNNPQFYGLYLLIKGYLLLNCRCLELRAFWGLGSVVLRFRLRKFRRFGVQRWAQKAQDPFKAHLDTTESTFLGLCPATLATGYTVLRKKGVA